MINPTIKELKRKGNFVYKFFCSDECVYVGRTNSIYTRFRAHKKNKMFDSVDPYVVFCELDSCVDSMIVEALLINEIKPFFNRDIPEGTPSFKMPDVFWQEMDLSLFYK